MTAKTSPVPQPPTLPLLGNLTLISPSTPIQGLTALAKQYGGLFQMRLIQRKFLVASSQAVVNDLCNEDNFYKKIVKPLIHSRPYIKDGLFTAELHEPNWGKAHRLLMPVFSHLAMHDYFASMREIVVEMIKKWEQAGPDEDVDVTGDMTRLTFDTISLCGFDFRLHSFAQKETHPFIDALNRLMAEIQKASRRLPIQERLMNFNQAAIDRDVTYIRNLVNDVIKQRRANEGQEAPKKDLLNVMLYGVDKVTGERLPDENIVHQIMTFLAAGHETTSGLLSFAVYFLCKSPEVLARTVAEVDQVLSQRPGGMPEFEDLAKMPFVTQVLKETLRLWPTAPAFFVTAKKDTVVAGGYEILAGETTLVLLTALHREAAVWGADAEVFNPARFAPEEEVKRPPNCYKPFGNGVRACIGSQFALQEACLALAMVLYRFNLHDTHAYQLVVKESLTVKPTNFKLRLTPRQPGSAKAPAKMEQSSLPVKGTATRWVGAAEDQHGTPLLILYGSNMGTCEEFANRLALDGERRGYDVRLASLDEALPGFKSGESVVIVTSSYNGKPTDNAVKFCHWLGQQVEAKKPLDLSYAVFGCGNRDWVSTYQEVPRLIDQGLAALGATRLCPRGDGDARGDMTGHFAAWQSELWPTLRRHFRLGEPAAEAPVELPAYQIDLVAAKLDNPFVKAYQAHSVTVSANDELQQQERSQRSTRHIEMALPKGLSFRVGDHLGVICCNSPELVERVMKRFGQNRETMVQLRSLREVKNALPTDQPLSLGELFSDFVELQDLASREHLVQIAKYTECPPEKEKLLRLAGENGCSKAVYEDEVMAKRLSLLDVLELVRGAQLPLNVYLGMLAPLKPRYYSISSSPLASADKLSITVGVVKSPARSGSGDYAGTCSTYLSRQEVGSTLQVFVRESNQPFHLPKDPGLPLIMVGPGTGFGPFRGFMQERSALKEGGARLGEALLFYGCRHPDEDFIYASEIATAASQQLVKVYTAFSLTDSTTEARQAAQVGPSYQPAKGAFVQDRMWEEREQIWALLERGAHVYVCGDASQMEPAVWQVLVKIIAAATGKAEAQATTMLQAMETLGRYAKDVWAPAR